MSGELSVDAVCFDLDDTLFDFEQYVRAGLESAADLIESQTGHVVHDELESLYFDEGVTEETFDVLVDRRDLPPDMVPTLVEAYHLSTGPFEPYPDVEPVLGELARYYPLGLVTDGRNGHEKLGRLGLGDIFAAVIVTHDHNFAKPDPRPFERVAESLGVSPRSVVYIGDNPRTDIQGPAAAGMATVRIRRGRFAGQPCPDGVSPDVEIESLLELPALLAGPDEPSIADKG